MYITKNQQEVKHTDIIMWFSSVCRIRHIIYYILHATHTHLKGDGDGCLKSTANINRRFAQRVADVNDGMADLCVKSLN